MSSLLLEIETVFFFFSDKYWLNSRFAFYGTQFRTEVTYCHILFSYKLDTKQRSVLNILYAIFSRLKITVYYDI